MFAAVLRGVKRAREHPSTACGQDTDVDHDDMDMGETACRGKPLVSVSSPPLVRQPSCMDEMNPGDGGVHVAHTDAYDGCGTCDGKTDDSASGAAPAQSLLLRRCGVHPPVTAAQQSIACAIIEAAEADMPGADADEAPLYKWAAYYGRSPATAAQLMSKNQLLACVAGTRQQALQVAACALQCLDGWTPTPTQAQDVTSDPRQFHVVRNTLEAVYPGVCVGMRRVHTPLSVLRLMQTRCPAGVLALVDAGLTHAVVRTKEVCPAAYKYCAHTGSLNGYVADTPEAAELVAHVFRYENTRQRFWTDTDQTLSCVLARARASDWGMLLQVECMHDEAHAGVVTSTTDGNPDTVRPPQQRECCTVCQQPQCTSTPPRYPSMTYFTPELALTLWRRLCRNSVTDHGALSHGSGGSAADSSHRVLRACSSDSSLDSCIAEHAESMQ